MASLTRAQSARPGPSPSPRAPEAPAGLTPVQPVSAPEWPRGQGRTGKGPGRPVPQPAPVQHVDERPASYGDAPPRRDSFLGLEPQESTSAVPHPTSNPLLRGRWAPWRAGRQDRSIPLRPRAAATDPLLLSRVPEPFCGGRAWGRGVGRRRRQSSGDRARGRGTGWVARLKTEAHGSVGRSTLGPQRPCMNFNPCSGADPTEPSRGVVR